MPRTFVIFALFLLTALTATAEGQPFRWSAAAGADHLEVQVTVPPGTYLDGRSIEFAVTGKDGSRLLPVSAPAPKMHGSSPILPEGVWRWRFQGHPPFRAKVRYQGCITGADGSGLCLMPDEAELLPSPGAGAEQPEGITLPATLPEPEPLRGTRTIRVLSGAADTAKFLAFLDPQTSGTVPSSGTAATGFLWMALAALLGGIALNLTPCVLPMIPINLAILGAGQDAAGKTGFFRGLAYGCGIAAAYGILGCAVILGGARFGSLNAMPWFNFAVAALFLLLATSAAGFLPLDFTRFGRVRASRLPGGALTVAFLMGAVAALLAGACVAPVVISVLLFSAERYQSGNAFALLLPLLLGAGMGLPWPFAGAGLGVLPKPGKYMLWIKNGFALLIAGAGLYYAGIGYSLLHHDTQEEFQRLTEAVRQSRAERKPLLIDFWANWCKNCKAMESDVLSKPEVRAAMQKFVVCKFQAEDLNDPQVRALLDHFQLPGLPGFVILDTAER